MPIVKKVEWFTVNDQTLGVVRAEDSITAESFIYIGLGVGTDEETDIQRILDWGAKMPEIMFVGRMAQLLSKD